MTTPTFDRRAAALLRNRFGTSPTVGVRAPGRVNLIGDHTDYSLLPVLPMAIGQGIDVLGVAATDGEVRAASTHTKSVAALETTTGSPRVVSGWGVYLSGVLTVLGERATGLGARIAVHGDLPASGGLSSSSALTVGLLAVLNELWSLALKPLEIVDLAIVAERISGVESGGMDQTVIALAEAGSALRIDFEPRAMQPVPIPADVGFVIGYSGSRAAKAAGARDHYNRSVVACRAAAALLATTLGVDAGDPPLLGRVAGRVTTEMVDALPESTTAGRAAGSTGVDVAGLVTLTGGDFPEDAPLRVQAAARHVLSEALRVDEAESALRAGELTKLGSLFDESHASLRSFGSVTPQLDKVTAAARRGGALGARVTGAGFGGWTVAVCRRGHEEGIAAAMTEATGGPAFPVTSSAGALTSV